MFSEETKQENTPAAPRGRRVRLELRTKLILVFAAVMLIPIVALTIIAWNQVTTLSYQLRDISIYDSTVALNSIARDNLERMTTDTAADIADFLYQCDRDILLLSNLVPSDEAYAAFAASRYRPVTTFGEWTLSDDGMTWVEINRQEPGAPLRESSNSENNNTLMGSGFRYRPAETYDRYHKKLPLYDEITFISPEGQELFKYVSPGSSKVNYPLSTEKNDVSVRENTYIRAETYWESLQELKKGDIYISGLIGAYVGTDFIGMYTPGALREVPPTHPNYETLQKLANLPDEEFMEAARQQAFAGAENPLGQRFEGIIRWASPVTNSEGEITGYVTMALNHDHIMDFINHISPLPEERNTLLPSAVEGNYAFLMDNVCRSVAHPRHHSIVGYNPLTGEPQVPWLEGSLLFERKSSDGSFVLDGNGLPVPVLDSDGRTQYDPGSPFYLWYAGGGKQWLDNNPAWNELSEDGGGKSWGEFYEENKDDREVLPQFGERLLRDSNGNIITTGDGRAVLDAQSLMKSPARALTAAGFVGLDGRYLNNAPQCTGWMELTEEGGSGSFYVYWSGMLKPMTAGAVPYYTGNYSPGVQGNARGFGIVSIGAGMEDFAVPAVSMEQHLLGAIDRSLSETIVQIFATSIAVFALIIVATFMITSSVTRQITGLVDGISRFREGDRSYRINSKSADEFGDLANAFDDMADSIENSVKTPLLIVDNELKVIYANESELDAIGEDRESIRGVDYHAISFYPPDSPSDPIRALQEGRDAEVFHRESDDRYLKGTADYLYDRSGNMSGYIIVTADVTDIQNARQRAEAANEAKTAFLSNMSHEIRTPLNVIMGMTTVGKNTSSPAEKDGAFDRINNASKHLLGIIDDILDVSKIEENKFSLTPVSFSLKEAISKVNDMISFNVREKRQKLTITVDRNIPDELFGDEQRLLQVLMNLMSNAVKFTAEEGSVSLDVSLANRENKYCTINFEVSDNGIGMSSEQQKLLFEAFRQVEESSTRRFGGTGLGLIISKNIVEMMDGEIRVKSELGKGTTVSFQVRLPYDMYKRFETDNIQPAGGERYDETPDFSAYTLLLVEDIEINREIVMVLLERTKLKIECALNGVEAVDMYNDYPDKYDLIFMDIQMPEMDGYTATKLIRNSGTPRAKQIPILAMTAHVFKEDIEKQLAAGMNDHIGKPVDYNILIEKMKRYLR